MRRSLDALYAASGFLAALFLGAICAIVVAQVALNVIDRVAALLTGAAIGLTIPSYSTFAGLFLAASTFFALAYTFRHGGHIRVSLVLQHLSPAVQRGCDVLAATIAAVFSGYFTVYMGLLAHESWTYGDVTPGMVAIPNVLPQIAMTLGLAVLTVAVLDDLVALLRGRHPAFRTDPGALLDRQESGGDDRGHHDDGTPPAGGGR